MVKKWQGYIMQCKHERNGYVLVKSINHPRVNKQGFVLEHLLVAEKALGRYILFPNCVHHVNENRNENRNNNLVICQDNNYHLLLHRRKRALRASNNANYRLCYHCNKHDDIENMIIHKGGFKHEVCKNWRGI